MRLARHVHHSRTSNLSSSLPYQGSRDGSHESMHRYCGCSRATFVMNDNRHGSCSKNDDPLHANLATCQHVCGKCYRRRTLSRRVEINFAYPHANGTPITLDACLSAGKTATVIRKRLGGGIWRYGADTGPMSQTRRPPTQYMACRGPCAPFPPGTCLLQLHPVHLQQHCLTLTQIWQVVGPFPRPVSASCIRAQTTFAWIPSRAGGLALDSIPVVLLSLFRHCRAGRLYW